MLTLATPVQGIAPMPINKTASPLNNARASIVGFGRTGGGRFDYGVKREGSVKLGACPASLADKKVICWRFDADHTAVGSASNTCNADSGGGVFMRDDDGRRVVEKIFGVVSGGRDRGCTVDDLSYNVDVGEFREWIDQAGEGRLSSQMCGSPLWLEKAAEPKQVLLSLGGHVSEATMPLSIPAGVKSLRIAMNAEDDGNGRNDFDLTAVREPRSTTDAAACNQSGTGQFAFCDIANPQTGKWTVIVTRKKGDESAQLTITAVSEPRR